MQHARSIVALLIVGLFMTSTMANAQTIKLDPPGDREFILDHANLISAEDEEAIRAICDPLLTENVMPIIVVTIQSMANHGQANMRIETFATILFDQWQIGYPEVQGSSWNRGMLLLVSVDDRKARIELGADWAHDYDAVCQRIMDEQIIPNFKQGNFSEGILAGVQGLDAMARGIPLPTPVRPAWFYPAIAVGIGLLVFTVVSLIRSGASGWAWLFWAALFGLIGSVLYMIVTASANSGSGGFGGFSGGSFGGGFSGGGGATGSW